MPISRVISILTAGAALLAAGAASATIVDFEGVAVANTQTTEDSTNHVFNGFNVFVPHGHYQGLGFLQPNPRPSNGSDWLLHDHFSGTLGAPVVVTQVGGGAFSVQSIDAAEWDNGFAKGQTLTMTGHLSGGGTVVLNFVTDQLNGFETFNVVGMDDIVQLDILGSTNGTNFGTLGYDNLVVGAPGGGGGVPEPLSLGLVGVALLGLGAARRRAR